MTTGFIKVSQLPGAGAYSGSEKSLGVQAGESVQLAWYQVWDIRYQGATGDGSTDDTAAFARASSLPFVYVSEGVFLIDSWRLTKRIQILMHPNAVLRLRSIPALGQGAVLSVVYVPKAAAGSVILGGTIDGNRQALRSRFVRGTVVMGLRAEDASGLVWRDTQLINCICQGAYVVGGSDLTISDLRIKDCSQSIIFDGLTRATITNIRATNIANDNFPVYQHASEWRKLSNCTIDTFLIDGHVVDSAALDAGDIGIDATRITDRCRVSNVSVRHYVSRSSRSGLGFQNTWSENLILRNLEVIDYDNGADFLGADGVVVDGFLIDCNDRSGAFLGLRAQGGGAYPDYSASDDLRANSASNGVTFSNGRVRRAKDGIQSSATNVTLSNVESYANSEFNLILRADIGSPVTFAGGPKLMPRRTVLNGVRLYNAGHSGLVVVDCDQLDLSDTVIYNNGQAGGGVDANGVYFVGVASDSSAKGVTINASNQIYDDQTWTMQDGISWSPGATDAQNLKVLLFLDASRVSLNQRITIVSPSGGANVVARIVNILLDDVTVQTSAPTDFTSAGHMKTCSGSVKTTGIYLHGTSSKFVSDFPGRTAVQIGNAWNRVVKVVSDTEAVLETALPADVTTPTALFKLTATAKGIPSQNHGIELTTNADDVSINLVRYPKHLGSFFQIPGSQYSKLTAGSRVQLDGSIPVVGAYNDQVLVWNVPPGFCTRALRIKIDSIVTGAAIFDLSMWIGGGPVEYYARGLSTAGGNEYFIEAYGMALAQGDCRLVASFNAPPSGGALSATITLERVGG